jgi:hypothetical protein
MVGVSFPCVHARCELKPGHALFVPIPAGFGPNHCLLSNSYIKSLSFRKESDKATFATIHPDARDFPGPRRFVRVHELRGQHNSLFPVSLEHYEIVQIVLSLPVPLP